MYSSEQKYKRLEFLYDVKAFVKGKVPFDTLVTRLVTIDHAMARVNNNNSNGRYGNLKDSHRRIVRILKLDVYPL